VCRQPTANGARGGRSSLQSAVAHAARLRRGVDGVGVPAAEDGEGVSG
jgi:hypothetical protein